MDGGASVITHSRSNNNTLLISAHIHTHNLSALGWAAQTHLFSKPERNLEFLSPEAPIPHIPPAPPPSTISVQPCYYLITVKVSQKPGFGPKSSTGGHNLADDGCSDVWFSRPFAHAVIKMIFKYQNRE